MRNLLNSYLERINGETSITSGIFFRQILQNMFHFWNILQTSLAAFYIPKHYPFSPYFGLQIIRVALLTLYWQRIGCIRLQYVKYKQTSLSVRFFISGSVDTTVCAIGVQSGKLILLKLGK